MCSSFLQGSKPENTFCIKCHVAVDRCDGMAKRLSLSLCVLMNAGNRKGRDIVREALRQASAAGLNVLRTFAHTTDDNFPFQVRVG